MTLFLAANVALREENTTLRNEAATPRHVNSLVPRSPMGSKSTDNFFLPYCGHPPASNPRLIWTPSLQRNLDHVLWALDDMFASPFVPTILNQDTSSHFSLPKFHMYNGFHYLFNHLIHFHQVMTLQTGDDALLCKVFLSSLAGPALSWFHRLALNTVTSFYRLSGKFVTQYMCSVKRKKSVISLFCVRMGKPKSIKDFMKRFVATIVTP